MKMLLNVEFPHEPFNTLVRDGKADRILTSILEDLKPESVYFTETDGRRAALLVIELEDASRVPFYAEPFFLRFNADCRFRIAMTPDSLEKAGLEKLGKKWG